MDDNVFIAIGMHYPDISEMVRAEMVRTAENNPQASREDFIADIARHLAAQVEPEIPEHPDHVDCADGCGLAVTHDGACLDEPGGRVVCTVFNHETDDQGEALDQVWAVSTHVSNAPDLGPFEDEQEGHDHMTGLRLDRNAYKLVWRRREP